MSLINHIKLILNYDVIIIFLVIGYILTFKISKEFKQKNYHRDHKIVKFTGIIYGLIAITAIIMKVI